MKTYILINGISAPLTADDIKVKDIYGIYQNKCKSFWECKIANLKVPGKPFKYVVKEIELDTCNIITTYRLENRNTIVNVNTGKQLKIPVFYNNEPDKDIYNKNN